MPGVAGNFAVDSNNFPTALLASSLSSTSLLFGPGGAVSSGPFTTAAAAAYVIGSGLDTGVALGQGPTGGAAEYLVAGVGMASIVNGAGADLAGWEAGTPSESFRIRVSTDGGATFSAFVSYTTVATVPQDSSSGFASNIGFVELDDFGIGAGVSIDAVQVEGLFTGIGGSGPDILALAILNAGAPTGNVPTGVPDGGATVGLLGLALAGGYLFRRRG
jgi:hypothetical protein